MIEVIIYRTKNHEYIGFDVEGHAGYGVSGDDIVCAAVSILVINTINSIEGFTTDKTSLVHCNERGLINFRFEDKASHDAHLLVQSMICGLQNVEEEYKTDSLNPYIDITFKEV